MMQFSHLRCGITSNDIASGNVDYVEHNTFV